MQYRTTHLRKVRLTMRIIPRLSAILGPVIVRGLAPTYPGVIIRAAAPAENFASRVGLLDSRVLRTVYQRRLESPIVGTATELEGAAGRRDLWHLFGVTVAVQVVSVSMIRQDHHVLYNNVPESCFNHQHRDSRVFCQPAGDHVAGCTAYIDFVSAGSTSLTSMKYIPPTTMKSYSPRISSAIGVVMLVWYLVLTR